MQWRAHITCLWPGLAPLWWRGLWSGLLEATLFALALNLLLLGTFVWPRWWDAPWPTVGWFALATFWALAAYRAWRQLPLVIDWAPDKQTQGLLSAAQGEYLKGNWYDAQKQLEHLLQRRPRDAEALLLLATVHRHANNQAAALRTLARLESLDGALRWQFEIQSERERLTKLAAEEGSRGPADVSVDIATSEQ